MKEAYKIFNTYVGTYDLTDDKINRKFKHSYRVALLCKKIAASLGLSSEDIVLAETIGLLHDLGRFEQVKLFDTYNDIATMDHALHANKLLFEDGLIKDYYQDSSNYEVIRKAIFFHNKMEIEAGLSDREMMFAKIIRDADKLDIFFIIFIDEDSFDIVDSMTSPKVLEAFYNMKTVDNHDRQNNNDHIFGVLAFTYDLNFLYSFEHLKKRKYLDSIIEVYKIDDIKVKEMLNKFIDERIDSYAQ